MDSVEKRPARVDRRAVILLALAFVAIVLAIVVFMNVKNTQDLRGILEDSIKSQLISISVAAREILDVDAFEDYNSVEDTEADAAHYLDTREQLRVLAANVGADYIYALKRMGDEYYFVFDTDPEDEEIFIPYDLSPVHEAAFEGLAAADVMNVEDEYGTFNTGAVPIEKDGRIIGIIATDIEDTYLQESESTARANTVLLIATMCVALGVMLVMVLVLMRSVSKMQSRLTYMAHHDGITGLPNRQYLLETLDSLAKRRERQPFALLFIDLDNFKAVNDGAGHEAGDELLRHFGDFLASHNGNTTSFRPAAGRLNIAARIGGDEFVQVCTGISTREEAAKAAQNLLDGFKNTPLDRFVATYGVGMSIGVALFPLDTESYHTLITYADMAMYHAKRDGKNCYRIYEDWMAADAEN